VNKEEEQVSLQVNLYLQSSACFSLGDRNRVAQTQLAKRNVRF